MAAERAGTRDKAERAVLKMWKNMLVHAEMGRRGGGKPSRNMVEWSTTAGWMGRGWDRPHLRQVVYMGEPGGGKG